MQNEPVRFFSILKVINYLHVNFALNLCQLLIFLITATTEAQTL